MKKITKKKYKIIVEKTNTGFSAYTEDLPVFTTGKNVTELQKNIIEALELYFDNDDFIITLDNISLEIDFKQFFQYFKIINAKFLAERIGMNPTLLSQYVQGKKKPSQKQSEKIINGIQQIGRELTDLRLIN